MFIFLYAHTDIITVATSEANVLTTRRDGLNTFRINDALSVINSIISRITPTARTRAIADLRTKDQDRLWVIMLFELQRWGASQSIKLLLLLLFVVIWYCFFFSRLSSVTARAWLSFVYVEERWAKTFFFRFFSWNLNLIESIDFSDTCLHDNTLTVFR